jgi:hypothetical protein
MFVGPNHFNGLSAMPAKAGANEVGRKLCLLLFTFKKTIKMKFENLNSPLLKMDNEQMQAIKGGDYQVESGAGTDGTYCWSSDTETYSDEGKLKFRAFVPVACGPK